MDSESEGNAGAVAKMAEILETQEQFPVKAGIQALISIGRQADSSCQLPQAQRNG